MRRFALALVPLMIAVGLQWTGYQNATLGVVLWVAATGIALWALLGVDDVRERLADWQSPGPSIGLSLSSREPSEPPDATDALILLREQAIDRLLNKPVRTESDVEHLAEEIDAWQRAVVKAMRMAGANSADVSRFLTLGPFPRGLKGLNAKHRKELDMLAERLERLLATIDRLERDAAQT